MILKKKRTKEVNLSIIDDSLIKEKELEQPPKKKPFEIKKRKRRYKYKRIKGKHILSFIPFRRIISEDCIAMDEGVTDYFEIEELPVRNGSKIDKATAIEEFWDFLRMMTVDCKFVLTNNPTDVTENIEFAKQRFSLDSENDTPYVTEEKQHALKQLEFINNNYSTGEIYLQVFGETEQNLMEVQDTVLSTNGLFFRIKRIPMAKKVTLIHSLFNFGDQKISGVPYTGNDREGRPADAQKVVDKKGFDPIFISQIQPMANINTASNEVIRTNKGFLKTLHITDYKKSKNPMFYGENVFKFTNTTATVDLFDVDKTKEGFEDSLNRSLGEYEDRVATSKGKVGRKKAASEYVKLDDTVDAILEEDESLKQIHVRIYVHEPTMSALEEKEKEIQTKLRKHGFHANCFLDEAEIEYRALFVSFQENQRQRKRKGQEIRAFSVAGSYFFNSAKLIDKNALYTGYTLSGGGLVLLNQFHKDRSRKSYGGFYIGNQGFGKSTEIKATAKTNRLLGNNTFMFMVSNEAERLAKACGGLHFDARDPKINPCQIYGTDMDIETNQIKEKQSFVTNITKMKIILSMAAELGTSVSNSSQKYLTQFYHEWMDSHNMEMEKITQYDPEQYPLYSDFRSKLREYWHSEVDHERKNVISSILDGLDNMIDTYGDIFNQKTELSLEGQKFVAFNLESLLNIHNNNIYNAQYFNLYNMVYSNAVRIGQREKHLYIQGEKRPGELIYTDIVSDEFHNPIRSANIELIKQMDRNNREGRKIFIGQHYAVHDIGDCFPDIDNRGNMGPVSQAVMNLYKLSTYRFIYRQDTSSLPTLEKIFGKEISQSDLQAITRLEEGQVHLNIKGTTNLRFKREISKKDHQLFEGSI